MTSTPSPDFDPSMPAADEVYPLHADSDPYFSVAQNVPSGPVISGPSYFQFNDDPGKPPRTISSEATEILEETDIRMFQLESEEAFGIDLPMPIRGGCCVDEEKLPTDVNEPEPASSLHPATAERHVSQDVHGRFMVSDNCIVEINGDEGFDYIDLSDRDIAHVMFKDSSIIVSDASSGLSFTIHYTNVNKAMFANGQLIDLP